jgi:hypothetical protein
MRLHDLKPRAGSKHRRKRLGQGESSGHGKTNERWRRVHLTLGVGRPVLRGWALDPGTATWISLVILGLIHGINTEPVRLRGGSGLLSPFNCGELDRGRASFQPNTAGVQYILSGRNARLNLLPLDGTGSGHRALLGPGLGLPGFGFPDWQSTAPRQVGAAASDLSTRMRHPIDSSRNL